MGAWPHLFTEQAYLRQTCWLNYYKQAGIFVRIAGKDCHIWKEDDHEIGMCHLTWCNLLIITSKVWNGQQLIRPKYKPKSHKQQMHACLCISIKLKAGQENQIKYSNWMSQAQKLACMCMENLPASLGPRALRLRTSNKFGICSMATAKLQSLAATQ